MTIRTAVVLAVLLLAGTQPAAAQRPPAEPQAVARDSGSEMDRLRRAGDYERAGDLEAATALVEAVLLDNPTSLTALLAYERLLGVQGRAADVVPAVDRLLEAQPASVLAHTVRLRAIAQVGDDEAVQRVVDAWIRATPGVETPYREAALVWRQRGAVNRALTVLERGRSAVDQDDALALELGDALAEAGDLRRAAGEWARAVGGDGRGLMLVQRRLQERPDGGADAVGYLIEQLNEPPATPGRQRAAALLAIDAGMEERARQLVDILVSGATSPREREQLLVELARRSDAAGLYRLAAWSYTELMEAAAEDGAGLAIRARVAELALLAGDTALAGRVYRELETLAGTGSAQRREAVAARLQSAVRQGERAAAAQGLHAFRAEFPRAPELDELAATLAGRYLEAGDADAALSVLDGVSGPRSAQVRGRIRIRTGDVDGAREALLRAAPYLHGREATETIALAAVLSRVSADGGEFIARAVAANEGERAAIIADAIADTRGMARAERAAVLDFVAGMAEASGMTAEADAIRREIVTRLPRTHEAPAALLALARRSLRRTEPTHTAAAGEEARVLLEKLILEYPRSALAPQARRELERLRAQSSGP